MPDAPATGDDNGPSQQSIIDLGEQRIRIRVVSQPTVTGQGSLQSLTRSLKLPGASDTAASFEFEGEDHTLGNALRYMIMKKYANFKPFRRGASHVWLTDESALKSNFAGTPSLILQKRR